MKAIIYQILRTYCRIASLFYFSSIEMHGRDMVPIGSPVILAPNHQNAFLDAILVSGFFFRPIHFLTRSDVFVKPYIWILSALNMMPVYRMRDGYEKLSGNESIFKKCQLLLAQHYPVLIFPEGNQGPGHFLRPLTKGTSRLALQTQAILSEDLFIVPVGINYFNLYQPRRKVILNFGSPIRVSDYSRLYETQKARGLIALRDELSCRIKEGLLIPEEGEKYPDRIKALHPNNEKVPFTELKQQINNLTFDRSKLLKSNTYLIAFHELFNGPPLWLIRWIIKTKVGDPQFIGPLKLVLGMLFFPLWWIIVFAFLLQWLGIYMALMIVGLLSAALFLGQEYKVRSSDT